jgi:hypothetical protein
VTRVIALPRALPGKTCAVTIARETSWDSPSEVLNQHSAPGQERTSNPSNWVSLNRSFPTANSPWLPTPEASVTMTHRWPAALPGRN